MTTFKCKMCGGALEITSGATVIECEYCGTQQTLPRLDNDKRANMYDRANHFRRNNEFDKAMGIYEQILNEDKTDAEAYWSIVLCRFGIEYVEDPASHKRIPTVNRAQFTSVFDDDNYKSALQYADADQRAIYEAEAKTINEIQKGILAISQKEEPFDVFICYKETDNNGRRTPDSVLAQELYYQLKQEELKVFFARITLEDKLGSAYEPYIFAALNSAKVMVVLGTKPEYFNAVWVKNEWSRYLALIKQGQKKILIPAYRDMDPYDLPEEFSHLQAQDMSKLGFMQDLIRGIRKLTQEDTPAAAATVVKETVIQSGNANTASLLKRAFIFLEDGDWKSADEYCEKVLDIDPENAQAYLGKMMAYYHAKTQEDLKNCNKPFVQNSHYIKILRYADDDLKTTLAGYIDHIIARNEYDRLEGRYVSALEDMQSAETEDDFAAAAIAFESAGNHRDAAELAKSCREKAEACRIKAETSRKNAILAEAMQQMALESITGYETAIKLFESVPGWKNANELVRVCKDKIEQIKAQQEAERLEEERLAELARIEAEARARKNRKIVLIAMSSICFIIAVVLVLDYVIIPTMKYNSAIALMDAGNYTEAIAGFEVLDGYKDSVSMIDACHTAILDGKYDDAVALMDAGNYTEAISAFEALDGHKDSATKINDCKYDEAISLLNEGNYSEALAKFDALNGYNNGDRNSIRMANECKYNMALALMNAEKYDDAITAFEAINDYGDSTNKINECKKAILDGKYNDAILLMDTGNLDEAYNIFQELENYKDAMDKASDIRLLKIKNAKVGDYIKFGVYEQDNNIFNGKEDIEWLLLDIEDGKALVISKYALDCKMYNEKYEGVKWDTCTLRKWLNHDFMNTAFSIEEKTMIPTVTVYPSSDPGKSTCDQIFLLDDGDLMIYFDSNDARQCQPTDYAVANGAKTNHRGICEWWIRSSLQRDDVPVIDYDGDFYYWLPVTTYGKTVRPAMWIDLSVLSN